MTLLAVAIAWLACAGAGVAGAPVWLAAPASIAVALLLPGSSWIGRAKHVLSAAVVVIVAVLVLTPAVKSPRPDSITARVGDLVRLRVRAEAESEAHPGYAAATARALEALTVQGWAPASGRLRLTLPAMTYFSPGDTIEVFGQLDGVDASSGGYAAWLARQGVVAAMAPRGAVLLTRPTPALPIRLWRDARDRLTAGLRVTLPPREASLAAALLFGARHALPALVTRDLAATGTTHLVTISSFNLLLLYGLIVATAAPVVGRRWAIVLGALAAALYGMGAGWHPSTIRGALLIALLGFAALTGRPYSPTALLVLAAAAMTVSQADLLGDSGFQLTFAAAGGIAVLAPPLRAAWQAKIPLFAAHPILTAFASGLLTSLAVAIASAPVLAAQSGGVTLYAPLANAVINPFVPLMTLGALLVGGAGSVWRPLGSLLAAPLWLALLGLQATAHLLSNLPAALTRLPFAGARLAAVWYAAIAAALLLRGESAHLRAAWRRARPHVAHERQTAKPRRRVIAVARGRESAIAAAALVLMALAALGAPRLTEAFSLHRSATTVLWLEADGASAELVSARTGLRVLLTESRAPAALAQALEEVTGDGRGVDVLVWSGDGPVDAGALRQVAAALNTQSILTVRGQLNGPRAAVSTPDALIHDAPRSSGAAPTSRVSLALGDGESIDLFDDGHGRTAALLRAAGKRVVLRDVPQLEDTLTRAHEPASVDVVTLRRRSSATNRATLAALQPKLVLFAGSWSAAEAEAAASVLPAARMLPIRGKHGLRLTAAAGGVAVSYAGR